MTDLHSYTHNYQSRGLPLAHATTLYGEFFLLQECMGTHACAHATKSREAASNIFLTTRLHGGGDHPDGCFSPPVENRSFSNNIMYLLHSCIHCDSDHSRSILQSHVTAFDNFFPTTRLYGSTLPDCTAAQVFEFAGFCPLL